MKLDASQRAVSLKRWRQAAFAGLAASLFGAAALGIWPSVSRYRQAERDLRAMETFDHILFAANRLSAERGPSNLVMSIEPGSDPAALERLQEFRDRTDQALAALSGSALGAEDARFVDALPPLIQATRNELAERRREVDRIAALPNAQRSQAGLRGAIDGLIGVVDRYQSVVTEGGRMLGRVDPHLAGAALTAQSVNDLREFGGRLASILIPSISRQQQLTPEVIERYHMTEGRLWEIQRLIQSQALFEESPAFRPIVEDAQGLFFARGIGLLRRLVEEGRAGPRYSLTVSDLNQAYVPTLKPLEDLRTLYLSDMVESLGLQRSHAVNDIVYTVLAVGLFLAVMLWLLDSVRRKILTPLLRASDMIVSLAANQTIHEPVRKPDEISEMRTLFSAVAVLAQQTDERRRLLEQFRVQAETDRLTRLANRCRFETMAVHALETGLPGQMGVIFFDLDLFKNVNDTFGHQAGDEVLFKAARRLEGLVGEGILFARIGGDEFAVLCEGLDERDQLALADRIVKTLARPFEVQGGIARIGSSVGIAVLRERGATLAALCHQADMALYEAKTSGRNRMCLFDERMERRFRERGGEPDRRFEPAA